MTTPDPTETRWDLAVAEQIKAEREARGWSRPYTYKRADMARSVYERIESGERSPRLDQLAIIASAFGLDGSELFRRIEVRYRGEVEDL